jgi:tetratricopeptide (TPR) repeat protein
MEYCALGSLRSFIGNAKITPVFVWKWMSQLAETLQSVHERKVVHHDIKPDNILVTEDRVLKISDFGIANTNNGTICYLSPEALERKKEYATDVRVDIYALGVTLLELLTGNNPFYGKSRQQILDLHETKEFGLNDLPLWQQELVLKAIAKIPEQRFQSMNEFREAIQARSVPIIFDREVIQAGELAEQAASLMHKKKWQKALSTLDYAEKNLKPNVNVLLQSGRYFLQAQQINKAKAYFDKALKWNPRIDIQKELGKINIELGHYPTAISLLSDRIHRNPSDYEAYNLLLECYYRTGRYEQGMDLAHLQMSVNRSNMCFVNNYYVCAAMHYMGKPIPHTSLRSQDIDNPFLDYNFGVVTEKQLSHNFDKEPHLFSKLLFMDYRFNTFQPSTIYCTASSISHLADSSIGAPIIQFGRDNFTTNDILVPGGAAVSRRHCVMINCKDDVWVYDLNSTGTYVNGIRVMKKMQMVGKNVLRVHKSEFEFTSDKGKLL